MEQADWQVNKSNRECSKYILEREVDCDAGFKVGEDQDVIKAHKFILRMRSPVFDRMFNGGFQESDTDPVIPDVSPAAFHTLLRYCYYECLNIEGGVALQVFYAATKYMLPILERAARNTLIEKLDSSKIWDACKYSTDVGDEELHAGCIKYLKGNLSETNILDVIRYAVTTGNEDLKKYCRKHLKENLSKSNILDITKYLDSVGNEKLHTTCTGHLKEHLTESNIWDIYNYALNKSDTKAHQHCREYFERDVVTVRDALQSVKFANIQHEVLLDVLHINDKVDEAAGIGYSLGISISEIELFMSCNKWAEAECLQQEIDPTGANKRIVLGECLSLIRFPTMLQKDLLTDVYPTGILTQKEIANLGQYIKGVAVAVYQVDFPFRERQFVVTPSYSASDGGETTVFIESEVRVMLSRVWTSQPNNYKFTLLNERTGRSWSMVLNAQHEKHVRGDNDGILCYIDIEPQVLEPGSRYSVTAYYLKSGTTVTKHRGIEYSKIQGRLSPYKEVKITVGNKIRHNIYGLTISLV